MHTGYSMMSSELKWRHKTDICQTIIVSERELLPAANHQGFKLIVHSLLNSQLVDVQMDSVWNLITKTCYNQFERLGEFKEVLYKNNMKQGHTILHTHWCLSHSATSILGLAITLLLFHTKFFHIRMKQ